MSREQTAQMTETELRALAKQIYDRVSRALDDVDPDEVECEESLGSLTIQLADGAKWILSMQPPVRQLWLAVASLGRAYHFDYEPQSGTWLDDKGEGIELLSHLRTLLKDVGGVDVAL